MNKDNFDLTLAGSILVGLKENLRHFGGVKKDIWGRILPQIKTRQETCFTNKLMIRYYKNQAKVEFLILSIAYIGLL